MAYMRSERQRDVELAERAKRRKVKD
jgi:hypothetical protein